MEIVGLSYEIGRTAILHNLSTECPDGWITAIAGPNGAGKTTLLRWLCGALLPNTASFIFGGRMVDPSATEWKKVVGIVPDSDALFGELTVEEQVGLTATLFGIGDDEQKERVQSLIDLFELSDRRNALGRELSAGMRKRLAIALSLVHAPQLFLLDEPLNSLDYAGGETLFELLLFLRSGSTDQRRIDHRLLQTSRSERRESTPRRHHRGVRVGQEQLRGAYQTACNRGPRISSQNMNRTSPMNVNIASSTP